MRCLYDVLHVQADAEASAIKRSYRSLALLLHPDKNPGDSTTYERFQELQRAYEVLSDPQEHQSTTVFTSFDDSPKGFYTVFSTLFKSLHSQEEAAAGAVAKKVDKPIPKAPTFGTSEACESDVKAFYAYWSCFQTVKDFSWLDPHDPQSGIGRHMRRLLEAENNKIRKAGKVTFVQEVRKLVDWVRAEDPRVQQAREKQEQKRAGNAAVQAARADKARKDRQDAGANYEDAEWIRNSEKQQLEQLEAEQALAAQQDAAQVFECIVCDKLFKTARALQRHEGGTNHQIQLKMLKLQMQAEDCLAID